MYLPNIASALLARSLHSEPPLNATQNSAVSVAMAARSDLTVSTDGLCSGTQTCLGSRFGESCSEWGYCGDSTNLAYSGEGCQPSFGKCTDSTISASPSTVSLSTFLTVTVTAGSASTTSASTSPLSSSAPPAAAPETTSLSSSSAPAYAASSSAAAPSATSSLSSDSVQYTEYLGTGEPDEGWPIESSWLSLDQLFEINKNLMSTSCKQWNVADNSAAEISDIKSSIETVSKSSSVDARFILAIILQESNGCVRAPTTTYSVSNPGLMQSYQGTGTCNPGTAAAPQPVDPCPASEITQMIKDGIDGTGEGTTSLTAALAKAGTSDVSKYYKAARIYNSGSVDVSGLLQDGVATHCYSSDVANRLLGWSAAPSKCDLNGF
ncbi:hypothetical protein AC578_8591 [Pseudocercospora eumusae]|uniref:Chitin-binding type-1 domain-containing protein n=1 Tax=Pseudocercospora eumusae TaxID=321146 RepID=A0A139HW39_9PEZI|nr:hypothetical protein AC578_8591 [Pseudocercospora eumusae]